MGLSGQYHHPSPGVGMGTQPPCMIFLPGLSRLCHPGLPLRIRVKTGSRQETLIYLCWPRIRGTLDTHTPWPLHPACPLLL